MKNKVSFKSLNNFYDLIQNSPPKNEIPSIFNGKLDEFLYYSKNEIRENLIIFSKNKRIAYLNKIIHDFELYESLINITDDKINDWLKKYKTTHNSIMFSLDIDNELIGFLNSYPATSVERMNDNYNHDKEEIQRDFCNYYTKKKLQEAIEFINNQFEIKEPSKPKLKTNLSVPELATLFRELQKLKPDIFDIKSKAELHRFVANNFTSKKQDNISEKGIRKNFNTPDDNAADFWTENMYTIIDNLKKSKEK